MTFRCIWIFSFLFDFEFFLFAIVYNKIRMNRLTMTFKDTNNHMNS